MTGEQHPPNTGAPSAAAATPTTGATAGLSATPAGSGTSPSSTTDPKTTAASASPKTTDQIVLEYLKQKGMSGAVMELTNRLKQDKDDKEDDKPKTTRERLEEEDEVSRSQRTLLAKSTGGGFGYDRDSAWPIVQWGVPDTGAIPATAAATSTDGKETGEKKEGTTQKKKMGVEEAQAYLEAFTNIQLWVLSLPDQDGMQRVNNPLERAHALLKGDGNDDNKEVSLKSVVQELIVPPEQVQGADDDKASQQFHLPPSFKAELLAVTFALLVHTFCEILEVGMESTAHMLRDAFQPVYEPLYPDEYRDLYQCTTTDHIMRLNMHNSQHMEALASLKSILVQVASYQLRREELIAQSTVAGSNADSAQQKARDQKVKEYDRNIGILKSRYHELSKRATLAFDKMHDLPFLRRARAVRWQLTLSTQTYGMLASFLSGRGGGDGDSLLAMSTLLQTKCILNVEHRDPLPFTPGCVLDELRPEGSKERKSGSSSIGRSLELNKMAINWATPAPGLLKVGSENGKLPFPKYHLDDVYDDETQARRDKRMVEFNRALLVNGFRRLEALERKREYEALPRSAQKRLREDGDGASKFLSSRVLVDALQPSVLLTTLCAASASAQSGIGHKKKSSLVARESPEPLSSRAMNTDASSLNWEEPGIGLCCAKICPPDGRRVAVGCDDSAVRIWSLGENGSDGGVAPSQVLLGHKNGFPVFDVDWNRDGRSLLSAGGDGTVRLWDTMAVGPFGEVASPRASKSHGKSSSGPSSAMGGRSAGNASSEPDMSVPGLRPENAPYTSGAALAVYRGHAPSSPVWAVSFSPSGYYFASAGGDATARLWTTDRPIPVRLFTGHTASNVNSVSWHPNANYVVSGSDDKTVRLWDIQTGRTVRLLTGCSSGVNVVRISPEGRYAAGAEHSGTVHLWDLASGKKISEFRAPQTGTTHPGQSMVHSLCFSACGSALAAAGDDCCLRIWDVRSESIHNDNMVVCTPAKAFPTRRTMLLDLQYTPRNLLLSVGKVITPASLAAHIPDSD